MYQLMEFFIFNARGSEPHRYCLFTSLTHYLRWYDGRHVSTPCLLGADGEEDAFEAAVERHGPQRSVRTGTAVVIAASRAT